LTQIDFWTPQELADELELSVQYVYQIIKGKHASLTVNVQRIGGRWLILDEDAQRFIAEYRNPQHYTPQDLAKAIGKSRKYVLDALTGYGGRKEPRLAAEKRGDRWIVAKEDAERFIRQHAEGLRD
jgi:transcriptional regulator with XRE-family HTH domain